MSKWVNTEKFQSFREERIEDNQPESNNVAFARKWPNPKMGDQNKPNEYHIRLLTDPNGEFYKKFHYHMFKSGEQWSFIMCPKTYGQNNYCPWCAITQLLYQGSTADKKKAGQYKRKDKYVGNIYVEKDIRDASENDAEKHLAGKTYLYEFPSTVEQQIKKEITDTENGWGPVIFDPEEGHNMILRIGAKKQDKDGKVWPDYAQTTFSKKASAIGDTDEDIKNIMDSTQSIDEYLEKSMWAPDKHEALLKSEMVWEDVEADFVKHFKVSETKEAENGKKESVPDPDREAHNERKDNEQGKKESKKSESSVKSETAGQSDQDLLDELANL